MVLQLDHFKGYGKRILIVDDEPMCLLGLKLLFEVCKLDMNRVDLAHNGKQAVQVVKLALEMGLEY